MVTRNHKFSRSYGYSRRDQKRDAARVVAEDLAAEPGGATSRIAASGQGPEAHLVLDLAPRALPHGGIDLRAVTGTRTRSAGQRAALALQQLARRSGRWLWGATRQLGQRARRLCRQQGQRLFDWVSWR